MFCAKTFAKMLQNVFVLEHFKNYFQRWLRVKQNTKHFTTFLQMFYFTCKHGLNIILTSGCQTTDLYAGEVWRISREQNVDISQAHIALAIWHSTCGKRYKHALRGVSTLVFVILNSTILMHYVLNLTKNYFRKS